MSTSNIKSNFTQVKLAVIKNLYTYRTLPIHFGYLFLFALLLAALLTLQEYLSYLIANYQYEFSWFSISANNTINFLTLAIISPIAANSSVMLNETASSYLRKGMVVGLISLLMAFFHRASTTILYNLVYSIYSNNAFSNYFGYWKLRSFGAGIISSFIYYWIVVGIFLTAISRKKLISKEKELVNARLHALLTQLRPHFLFNTLNSISSLIDIDKSAAQKMIARFGELLRAVLEKEEKQFISLQEEITFIENYLSIESERFSDRLSISYDLDPKSLQDMIPTLILQPLVENAIKHGMAKKISDGVIEISSKILNGIEHPSPHLELSVNDNGEGLVPNFNFGVGLKNVSNRLSELYGVKGEFKIESNKAGGCKAKITIPLTNK
ncbi:MAG: histidine kinase [Cyclobacteriaceae bacterium]